MNFREIKLLRIAMMLLMGCILGFLLLTLIYCLPTPVLKDAQGTAELFRDEGNRPMTIPSYTGSTGDGYTDALMIAEALFDDPSISPLDKAVYVYREAHSESASADLVNMIEGKPMQWVISYERYWHGFLVFLRPLLLFFSYADLRMLICCMQVFLLGLVIMKLTQLARTELIVPFVSLILTLSPMGIMFSMQYFAVYAIMVLGVLGVLYWDSQLAQKARYSYFFLLLGMLTCYFDLLTYPLVTLGIPLLLVLYLHVEERGVLPFAVSSCVAWGTGYLGLWALKWIVGSLLVGDNFLMNAYYRVLLHVTTKTGENSGRIETIIRNISVICKPGYAVLYSGSLLLCARPLLRKSRNFRGLMSGNRLLLIAIGVVPFLWWLFAATHSFDHSFFTYREVAIAVFACLLWLTSAQRVKEGA